MQSILVLLFALAFWTAPASAYQIFQGPPAGKASDTFVQVSPDGEPLTGANSLSIVPGDSAAIDAAGRQRVSLPIGVFEDKRLYGTGEGIHWLSSIVGDGASVTFLPNEDSVSITIGTASGERVFRESRYLPYIPGKSASIKITGVFGAAVPNLTRRLGYYNDENGLFFQQAGTVVGVGLRTSTSGSPVDTVVPQSSWNLDRLDGSCALTPVYRCAKTSNPSGITLDTTKVQLFTIDFLWQGVGRVRYGLQLNGRTVYVHEVMNSNVKPTVFIGSPSLPIRYEIVNTGISTGGTLKQICVSVDSEGGYTPPGLEFAAANGISVRAITTVAPVLAIRLATSFGGKANRKIARILHLAGRATTNDAFCELRHIHGVTGTTGGEWVAVSTESAVEVNTGVTSITSDRSHTLDINYAVSGQGQSSSTFSESLSYISDHSIIHQNIDSSSSQYFAIYCTSFSGTSNLSFEINWQEYD